MNDNLKTIVEDQKTRWKTFIQDNKEIFDDFFYKNYLALCQILTINKNKITILVPSKYTKRILLEKRIDQKFSNSDYKIIFTVYEKEKKKKINKKRDEEFTFENLIIGKFNRGVVDVAKKIINKENIWSPFFIYSEPGLGKTHVLKAIQNKKKQEGEKCYYSHANDFGRLLLEKFNEGSKSVEEFSNLFNKYDVIIFDDVQLLARREKTNEVLFKIFTNAIDYNKQIIFSSDQHPLELNGFEKRLKSRFQNGVTLKIDYPDTSTAKKIVEQKIEKWVENISKIDLETIEFIAKTFKKDIRQIEGVVKRISLYLSEDKEKEINLNIFKNLFNDQRFVFENNGYSIKKIKKIVADFYNVGYNSLSSKSRKSAVVKARSVTMYLIRSLTNDNYSVIASHFNAKTHSTVINAIKKIKTKRKHSPEFQNETEHLKRMCQKD